MFRFKKSEKNPIKRMIEEQLIARGIKNENVLKAMERVKREIFVSEKYKNEAYDDHPIPIQEGQTISQPYMVALMTELLEIQSEDKILEIGTGSGYQTAILAELAKEVYTIERIEKLSLDAQRILNSMGYKNIFLKVGDGTLGWKEFSPFQKILVTAAAESPPSPLLDQLASGGRMVIPLGDRFSQTLTLVEKRGRDVTMKEICGCIFVPLIGLYGWDK